MAKTGGVLHNRLFPLVSLVCAVAATVMTFIYLSGQQAQEPTFTTESVIVAARDLGALSLIDATEDLVVKPIPVTPDIEEYVDQCLKQDMLERLDGKRINRPILTGTPLLIADLVEPKHLEVAGNKRALSIEVSGSNAVSGLIKPGDKVQLAITREIPTDPPMIPSNASAEDIALLVTQASLTQSAQFQTELLKGPYKVLAVGQQIAASRLQVGYADDQDEVYSAVTLEVDEEQARLILEKSGAGRLPITLLLYPRDSR